MSDQQLKALCCTCGAVRTCRRPRNYRHENYWLAGPIDRDWHRETGDLKCAECGRVTTHAIIRPEGDGFRDHAEMMQRVATGNGHGHFNAEQLVEVRRKYNQGQPHNPELLHLWYRTDAQEDWDAGRRETTSLCGRKVKLHRDPSSKGNRSRADESDDSQITPREIRDQEYEDEKTGMSWQEMDCVDCLRTWHLELLRQRRAVLLPKLTQFLADLIEEKNGGYPKRFELPIVNGLIEALENAYSGRSAVKAKDATR